MNLEFWKDIVLLISAIVVSGIGIFDRRGVIQAKDSQIELLKERIALLQENQSPEAVLSRNRARVELAEIAVNGANDEVSTLTKEIQEIRLKSEGKNLEQEAKISNLQQRIDYLSNEVKELSGFGTVLSRSITEGTAAMTNIAGSALFQEYAISKEYDHGTFDPETGFYIRQSDHLKQDQFKQQYKSGGPVDIKPIFTKPLPPVRVTSADLPSEKKIDKNIGKKG